MGTAYPAALDTFDNPSAAAPMNSVATPHSVQHGDANDAIEALEAKLGIGVAPAAGAAVGAFLERQADGTTQWVPGTSLAGGRLAVEASASAGASNLIQNPDTNSVGAGVDVVVVLGGTTAFPHTLASGISLAVIGGGYDNEVAQGIASTIAGGAHHLADAPDGHIFIGGGSTQIVRGAYGVAVGGLSNICEGNYAATVGGRSNIAGDAANRTTKTDQFVGAGQSNEATGNQSACVGGFNNTVTGAHSFNGGGSGNIINATGIKAVISGGEGNLVGSTYGTVPGGFQAYARRYGQLAYASGCFAAPGDSQLSEFVVRNQTTNGTLTELYLDGAGATQRMALENDTTWAFDVLVVARRTDVDGESAAYRLEGCIDRNSGAATVALVGAVTKTVLGEDTAAWDVDAVADTAQGSLRIQVTGEAAKTIRWVAAVRVSMVTG